MANEQELRRMQCKHIRDGELNRVASFVYKTDRATPLAQWHQRHIEVVLCALCSGMILGFVLHDPVDASDVPKESEVG